MMVTIEPNHFISVSADFKLNQENKVVDVP